MFDLAQHIGTTLRQVRRAPGLSLTVILTLALGIGSTTAVFSLVEGILLKPLPFKNPERLVVMGDHVGEGLSTPVTAREIGLYSSEIKAFDSMGGFADVTYELSGGDVPEEVAAARFTAGVFHTLGVEPIRGRVFSQQEEESHQSVAVISYSLWNDRYQSSPDILKKTISLDRKSYSIIGVMPPDFEFPAQSGLFNQTKLWVPMSLTPQELSEEHAGYWGYQMIARLRNGVSSNMAEKDVDRVAKLVMKDFPPALSAIHIRGGVTPLLEDTVGGVRPALRTLFGAVTVVLLIACVNVAGLLTVRAIRRRREYALRLALGARFGAIIREAVIEGLALSIPGGLLGLGFATAIIMVAPNLLPAFLPRLSSIALDVRVVMFAIGATLLTGVLCSLAPAFAALHTIPMHSLKEGGRTETDASGQRWLRSGLIVAEIAVALVLLTVAGVFLRSFQKMRAVDPGFRPEHAVTASYRLPLNQYSTDRAVENFNRAILDRLEPIPGVTAVGITSALPASGFSPETAYTLEGRSDESWKLEFAGFAITDGDYFHAIGIPLLDGRYFTPEDRANSPLVIIVNQSMARHCWPGQSAIGKRLHVGSPQKRLPWATVIGVVADTRFGARDEPVISQWFAPESQPATLDGYGSAGKLSDATGGNITIRSKLPAQQITQILRSVMSEIDPMLALEQVQTMEAVISSTEAPRRFNTYLITGFAAGALLLTITGIYAVVAFSVSLRTQEIAIRMAMGAQRISIARLVLLSGAKIAAFGCATGLLASMAVARIVTSFLFEVSPFDPLVYALASVTIIVVALLASSLPAMRAAAADPMDALKSN